MTIETALNQIMQATASDSGNSRETVRGILEELAKEKEHDPFNEDEWPDDSPAGRAPQTELTANYIRLFVESILHGDDDHRLWLKEAAECFIDGRPMPERPCPCLKESTDRAKQEEWGCVFHDEKQVWQIIGRDGGVLIDEIGEFRYPDRKREREAIKRLAEQIRDQHNYALMKLRPNKQI